MILSQIAAMARNRVIGKNNQLPWSIPEDMQFFRNKTKGHCMIMGRKTFDSLNGLLPGRFHIVISRSKNPPSNSDRLKYVSSVEEAIAFAKTLTEKWGDEVFVIGGGEIYRQAMPFTDRVYLTVIEQDFDGDAYFPEFDLSQFLLRDSSPRELPIPFTFRTYERAK